MAERHHETHEVGRDAPREIPAPRGTRVGTRQEDGITFIQVFTLAIRMLLGIQSLKFLASWYDHLQLKEAMQHVANDAPLSMDASVISGVLAKAQELQILVDPRDIHLERSPGARTSWRRTI